MDSRTAQSLMQKYANALAYIEVEKVDGTKGIGSCFHVGNGIFITARHVVEGNIITEIKITEPVAITTKEYFDDISDEQVNAYENIVGEILRTTPKFKYFQSSLNLKAGPFYHPDPNVDVAIFQVSSVHPKTGVVRLGSHLDDWIDPCSWRLSEAIVLGYPPIPLTSESHLVGARAEVNATVSLYSSRYIHFILSAIPRGGFSGGLALSEHDFALGLVTQSLVKDNRYEESGFFTVLSIEPIYECLSYYKLLPSIQKNRWDDFWNTYSSEYIWKEWASTDYPQLIVSLELIDDGEKIGIGLCSYDKPIFCKMDTFIKEALNSIFTEIKVHETFSKYMFDFVTEELRAKIANILTKLMNICLDHGLVTIIDQLTPELTTKRVT